MTLNVLSPKALFLNSIAAVLPQNLYTVTYTGADDCDIRIENYQGNGITVPVTTMKAIMEHADDQAQIRLAIAQLYARANGRSIPTAQDQARLAAAHDRRQRRAQRISKPGDNGDG